jgi:hypothetical protein
MGEPVRNPKDVPVEEVKRALDRAAARFAGGLLAASRPDTLQGELDSNFEGVVAGINFVVEAYILGTTGLRRKVNDADAPTQILSVVTALNARKVRDTPSASRLTNLNARRNASAHQGTWLDGIDSDALRDAAVEGQRFHAAVKADLKAKGLVL